ncbi:hypothetical protein A3K34_04725 [candidate division WWE3 bacterium RIFOXYC1_FULL_40_10]|uniref:Uncharacterized protein n=1 Tax=candidate division WWE3 bacterium RIFOXYA2_FULL_46_9 TaxID=1802636 RepID=A0A1F4W1C8_UNCKA|nr:MAG: hypothetical protein A3K58_04725 [candidate division WWE3 bacterium RIFOXYB1_FULL_40_22]OGC62142.1 MAG: hypothetical protein A3K37_04725 [candidate division WWE3 bacterium RIFOXYA1_FULL_40_11]OGC63155.1 MAG: hypothetical protein A2264_00470 [candidate division WWE3 bacterium RIFOXYA2_FULL_46_9]OGC64478.1 MAG: hypothetical protein A2326_04015 [candidate division WWE3 bacterium RIFOXYB2_FULL_41_6]OGC66525.1 MAG: hypothetical protein A3K34_04725 [candidate division WWE3 bacterium RIFOXYC1_
MARVKVYVDAVFDGLPILLGTIGRKAFLEQIKYSTGYIVLKPNKSNAHRPHPEKRFYIKYAQFMGEEKVVVRLAKEPNNQVQSEDPVIDIKVNCQFEV